MHIVELTKSLMFRIGSAPVLYLMIALSIGSLGVIIERAWVLFRAEDDVRALDRDLFTYLETWDVDRARARLHQSPSPAAPVLRRRSRRGVARPHRGLGRHERRLP